MIRFEIQIKKSFEAEPEPYILDRAKVFFMTQGFIFKSGNFYTLNVVGEPEYYITRETYEQIRKHQGF